MKKQRFHAESRTARVATGTVLTEILTGVQRERRMAGSDVSVEFGIVGGKLVATVRTVGVAKATLAVYRVSLEAL